MMDSTAVGVMDLSPGAETDRMSEEEFREFYSLTARSLRAYLRSLTREAALADDILQEAYLRLLKINLPVEMTPAHRKNYLYRTAVNLLRDHKRRERSTELKEVAVKGDTAQSTAHSRDLSRALDRLTARERELVWLAYVEQFSHDEIAEMLGTKVASVRPMLFRAKQRLADILKRLGYGSTDL